MKDALASFARVVVPAIADLCLIHIQDGDAVELAVFEIADPGRRELAYERIRRYPPHEDSRTGIARVLAGGPAELYEQIDDAVLAAEVDAEQLPVTRTGGYRSAMVVPVQGSRGVRGAITFVCAESGRRYSATDLASAEHLGRLAGLALESAEVAGAERRAREHAERLQRFTTALASTLEVGEVARTLVEAGIDALGAAAGFAWLLDETGTALELAAHTFEGPTVEAFRRFSIDAPVPLCDAMKTKRPILFERREEMEARYPAVRRASGTPFDAWATLPLLYRDRALGGVSWSFAGATCFDDATRGVIDTMAQQTALAIERCRLLAAERRARDLAHTAERKKDEFLAVLGHELRNPLAPLATAIDLMRMKDPDVFRKEREVAERAVAHLARLIDDLLDVSRITRGLLQLAHDKVDLADAVARAIEIASPLYDRRRHHLRVEVPAQTFYVRGDAVRLAQIFANLLTNAAKYTPEGGHVAIVASRDGDDAIVRVSDDGPGIAPELLPHVFDLFVQGARGLDRGGEGGLGIGLTLVRRLVELHGGRVTAARAGLGDASAQSARAWGTAQEPATAGVRAREDEMTDGGTVITVRLPLGRGPSDSDAGIVPPPAVRKKVLVVDDNIDAAELLAAALRALGHEVAVAFDGPSALDLAAIARPDVCVLDLGLPVMDGFEVAERLRARGEPLTLIAVTGYGQDSDRARTRAVGFDHHLVKPVDLDALALAISSSRPRP